MEEGIAVRDVVEILSITMQVGGKLLNYGFRLTEKSGVMAAKMMNTLYLGKWKGKTSLTRFRAIKGEDMQFMCIHTEDPAKLKDIFKEMEKHGILSAKLPDLCTGDGTIQFIYSPSDASKMEAFLVNHSKGKHGDVKIEPTTASAYYRNGIQDGEPTPKLKSLEASARDALRKGRGIESTPEQLALPDPDRRSISVGRSDVLWSHKRLMAVSVPGQREALLIGKEDVKEAGEKNIDLIIRPGEYYRIMDKYTKEISLRKGDVLAGQMAQPSLSRQKEQLQKQLQTVNRDMGRVTRITINEKMFQEKYDPDKEIFRTRIPHSKDIVAIPTRHCHLINGGKNLETYLYDHLDYTVDGQEGRSQRSGMELRKNYDDKTRENDHGKAKNSGYDRHNRKTVQNNRGNRPAGSRTGQRQRAKTPIRKR